MNAAELDALPPMSVIQTPEGVLEHRAAYEEIGGRPMAEFLAWFDTDAAMYESKHLTDKPIRVLSVGGWDGTP